MEREILFQAAEIIGEQLIKLSLITGDDNDSRFMIVVIIVMVII